MVEIIGMRVRDRATGLVVVDVRDRLTRRIGVVNSGAHPSSIVVDDFSLGEGWAVVLEAPVPNQNIVYEWKYPRLSINGNVLSWDFPGRSGAQVVPCDIMYGVY